MNKKRFAVVILCFVVSVFCLTISSCGDNFGVLNSMVDVDISLPNIYTDYVLKGGILRKSQSSDEIIFGEINRFYTETEINRFYDNSRNDNNKALCQVVNNPSEYSLLIADVDPYAFPSDLDDTTDSDKRSFIFYFQIYGKESNLLESYQIPITLPHNGEGYINKEQKTEALGIINISIGYYITYSI